MTLAEAVAAFIEVQDRWLEDLPEDAKVPLDWLTAYRDLKMASESNGGEQSK